LSISHQNIGTIIIILSKIMVICQ